MDGDGGFDYALPSGFTDGFSLVQAIFYPYETTDQDPPALDPDEWTLFRTATGLKIRFLADSPTAAEDFLVQYTAPHTLSAATSTIPATDDEAVADLAAAEAYLMLAGYFAVQANDNSISVDSVDRRTKAQECRDQSAAYRKSYARKIGADTETVRPASAWGDVDSAFGDFTRSDYFAHGRRRFCGPPGHGHAAAHGAVRWPRSGPCDSRGGVRDRVGRQRAGRGHHAAHSRWRRWHPPSRVSVRRDRRRRRGARSGLQSLGYALPVEEGARPHFPPIGPWNCGRVANSASRMARPAPWRSGSRARSRGTARQRPGWSRAARPRSLPAIHGRFAEATARIVAGLS